MADHRAAQGSTGQRRAVCVCVCLHLHALQDISVFLICACGCLYCVTSFIWYAFLSFSSQVTTLSDYERCTEIIRQQIFQNVQQEVPYLVTQENRDWTRLPKRGLRIDQELQVRLQVLPGTTRHRVEGLKGEG